MLRRWCDEVGRDHTEIERTLQGGLPIIRDTEAEAKKVAAAMGRAQPGLPRVGASRSTARPRPSPSSWAGYLDLGFEHVYVDCPAPFDHETLERLATEVKPMLERAEPGLDPRRRISSDSSTLAPSS